MEKNNKQQLLKSILSSVEQEYSDEDIIHLLLNEKMSINTEKQAKEKYTLGQRAADKLAKFAGSWVFIFIFMSIMAAWICTNIFLLTKPFDPYPFILLNLALSCLAAIQAPLIMMSQNRQEEKDRQRAENDYKVNLKAEFIIQDLHEKIDTILDLLQKDDNPNINDLSE